MTAVRILRLAAGGDGVGRLDDGRAVFVPRAAPGDLVELGALREHRRFARARIARLLEPAPERVEPRCPHYVMDHCGGCQLQHVAAPAQREARRGFVGDALRRLARREVADPPLEAADREFDYRTKITLATTNDGRRIGLHPYDRPAQVFELEWCHITAPELMRLWGSLRSVRRLLPPGLTSLVLRLDRAGGRHALFTTAAAEVWDGAGALLEALVGRGEPATVWWRAENGAARAMAGTGEAFPATVFEQINPVMGDRVRAHAVAALGPLEGRRVWDLYAGVGETTAALARAGAEVESVESDRRAVAEAERRGPHATRHVARVESMVARMGRPALVVTNPPRTGMEAAVAFALERAAPARVVYVSCDPATLARDLTRLPSYRLSDLRAFDLFPQTAHVETVAVLDRAS